MCDVMLTLPRVGAACRYLLGRDFPNQRIGPEPTTDRFVAVMNGPIERSVPGNALCVQVSARLAHAMCVACRHLLLTWLAACTVWCRTTCRSVA